jgi:hypothetical protein
MAIAARGRELGWFLTSRQRQPKRKQKTLIGEQLLNINILE